MFDKDNKFGFINNSSNNNGLNSSDIKKYIDDKADILELKNIQTISENLYSKNFLIVESKLSDIISFEQMRNSTVNNNYKAPLFVCNINKSLDDLNDLDELFFSVKYKIGNEIKTGAISGDIKYGKSFQMELSDAINYSGVKIKYGYIAVKVLPNKRCTNATTTIDDNSYCVLQVRISSGYISEEDINSIKNSVVSVYVRRRNYLTLDNSNEFTPTDTYQPATKKYVDNKFLIDELETVLTVPQSELDKCNDSGAGISPSQNLNVINPNDGKHIYYACYGDIINELTYVSNKTVGYTGTLCELEDGHVIELCMTFSNNNLVTCSTALASVKNYVFTNDLIIKSKKVLAIDEIATKEYVGDNAVILPLPVHTIQETTSVIVKIVNIMDLIEGVQYSTHKDPNETRTQSYRIAYVCDDGSFKLICSLPLKNKVVHLLKVVHSTKDNYSTLSYNNIAYKVDYTKHSTNTDVEVTETLQNYLPIANITEYTPTKDYHPATKKYVDDRFVCSDVIENVGIIPKEEMQKCNNGTSRYVSSINLKEFFADYKYAVYQGTYGDKNIRIIYDAQYNRMIAYDLDTVDKYDITLGFTFDNNYMYPFSGEASQVKSYQFTNDLVITKNAILNPNEVYENIDNSILEIYLNAETPQQSTNDLVIGKNYIIMDSIANEYVSKSFFIGFNYNNDNQYLESIIYFETSEENAPITITPSTTILAEDGFDWTFSGYKHHILTFKKIRDMLFLTYNSYSILPS